VEAGVRFLLQDIISAIARETEESHEKISQNCLYAGRGSKRVFPLYRYSAGLRAGRSGFALEHSLWHIHII